MVYFKKTLIKVDRASMVHGLEVKVPFKEKLLDPSFYGTMGFDEYEIEKMLSHHILNKKDYKWPLFFLYSLSIWNDKGRKTIEKM